MDCVKVDIKNKRTIFTSEKIPEIILETDVIVKVAYAGVCGTDLHIIQGQFDAKDGIILGHEIVGTIHDISPKYSHLAVGDRVALNPNRHCGMCTPCRRKLTNFCDGGGLDDISGINVNGGWAEYCRTHVSLLTKLPDNVSLEQGVLCEPLSCIIHGLDKLQPLEVGSNILIVGAGIIGILWCSLLHLLGHKRVVVSEPNKDRQNTVRNTELGYPCLSWDEILENTKSNPDWADYKADVCIDCSGNVNAMQAAISLIRPAGMLVIFGVSSPDKSLTISPYDLFKNEITIMGVKINTPESFQRAICFLESMSDRYLQINKLGMKTFPLNEHENALNAFRKGSYTKIVFKP